MGRDPRVEPRAGDWLTQPRFVSTLVDDVNTFHVTERNGNVVHYRFNGCDGFRTSVANWRMGRATATVIHVSEGRE